MKKVLIKWGANNDVQFEYWMGAIQGYYVVSSHPHRKSRKKIYLKKSRPELFFEKDSDLYLEP